MRVHVETVSVRYAETDRMGVAHHSSFLLWFEVARTGLLRAAGFAYHDLEGRGVMLPVVEYGARFLKSADYDDRLAVETHIRDLRSRVVTFDYRVVRSSELIAEGFTRHVCADAELKPRRVPDEVAAAIAPYAADASES